MANQIQGVSASLQTYTENEYDKVVELSDRLTGEVGKKENYLLASFIEILGVLIEKYEDENISEITKL